MPKNVIFIETYQESPYRSLYINIARWCNQPAMFKKTTLREFARMKGEKSSYMKSILDFERKNPEMAYYLDLRFENVAEAERG